MIWRSSRRRNLSKENVKTDPGGRTVSGRPHSGVGDSNHARGMKVYPRFTLSCDEFIVQTRKDERGMMYNTEPLSWYCQTKLCLIQETESLWYERYNWFGGGNGTNQLKKRSDGGTKQR